MISYKGENFSSEGDACKVARYAGDIIILCSHAGRGIGSNTYPLHRIYPRYPAASIEMHHSCASARPNPTS